VFQIKDSDHWTGHRGKGKLRSRSRRRLEWVKLKKNPRGKNSIGGKILTGAGSKSFPGLEGERTR